GARPAVAFSRTPTGPSPRPHAEPIAARAPLSTGHAPPRPPALRSAPSSVTACATGRPTASLSRTRASAWQRRPLDIGPLAAIVAPARGGGGPWRPSVISRSRLLA